MTGQQVQPKYSRRCSGILRLSGPNQPRGLILGMVKKCWFSWSTKIVLIRSSGVERRKEEEEVDEREGYGTKRFGFGVRLYGRE